jgi:hypothetical protein
MCFNAESLEEDKRSICIGLIPEEEWRGGEVFHCWGGVLHTDELSATER